MRRRTVTSLAACFAALPQLVYAQGHSHTHHGGQVQKIGRFKAELVVRGAEITLHLLDERERPVDTVGLSALATVLARGNEQRAVEMRPAGDNRLADRVDFPVGPVPGHYYITKFKWRRGRQGALSLFTGIGASPTCY